MATISGTRANDILNKGTSAADTFFGGGGSDTMYGGGGNDTFFANDRGSDTFYGGTGSDMVNYSKITQQSQSTLGDYDGVIVNLALSIGSEVNSLNTPDHYFSIENVTGSNFNDFILGDGNQNLIRGLDGRDVIEGGAGADTLDGGAGIDALSYSRSSARVVVDLQSNSASEGDAKGDVIMNFENLSGSEYGDILVGNGASNWIVGLGGNDRINGRGGDDTIHGGAGNDTLTGGSGGDKFVYNSITLTSHSGTDHITDFNVHEDRIEYHLGSTAPSSVSYTLVNVANGFADMDISLGTSGHVILDHIAIADINLAWQDIYFL